MRQADLLNTNVTDQGSVEKDFSLVLGGPLYNLYLRTRLARSALELVVRRVVTMSLICWLPLLLLALVEGHGFGGVSGRNTRTEKTAFNGSAALGKVLKFQ